MADTYQPASTAATMKDSRRVAAVEHVDAVMRAVSAMLRSGPNFDGRIGEVEAAVWAAIDGAMAAERAKYAPLMQAVEWLLDDGHMNQEHLARLRAAWEGA
ncbi:MAG: hypothetical protein RJA55_2327 [Acidobacteriota bacterium]|jgi:predicted RNase H-like nuclease